METCTLKICIQNHEDIANFIRNKDISRLLLINSLYQCCTFIPAIFHTELFSSLILLLEFSSIFNSVFGRVGQESTEQNRLALLSAS